MRAYLVDDEPLALKRLRRLIEETGRLEIVGQSSDSVTATSEIARIRPDVVFLDIEMPEQNGFELLSRLHPQPFVIFTTAYSQYALKAFEVNSIDYLLKPIEREHLDRALGKLERGLVTKPDVSALLAQILEQRVPSYPTRISSKIGDKVEFIDLSRVTHFFADDKLTFAATETKNYLLDSTISDLESKLDPKKFFRVHRATLVNLDFVHELYSYFSGKMLVRLKDAKRSEITVARERVKELKSRLGVS